MYHLFHGTFVADIAAGTEGENLPSIWLLLPLAALIISVSLAFWICTKFRSRVDGWLSKSKNRRLQVSMIFSAVELVIISLLIEAADLSEILHKRTDALSLACITAVWPFMAAFFVGQYLILFHDDQWETRIARAEVQIARAEQEASEARDNRDFIALLHRLTLKILTSQHDRIRATLSKSSGRALRMPAIISALAPNTEAPECVGMVLGVFDRDARPEQYAGQDVKIRVSLFRAGVLRLESVCSFDGIRWDCVRSAKDDAYAGRFQLDQIQENLAVYAAHFGRIEIVPDTEAAHADADSAFHFFHKEQRDKIKSLLVLPLPTAPGQKPARYVVTVDVSVPGFFSEDRRPRYEMIGETLAQRLHFADSADALLQRIAENEGDSHGRT